ncbi:MAG: hypothetical protein ACPG8W_04270 [Candidatus Promineifilaceae bacterium]
MNKASSPKISRRKFLGLSAAVVTAAAWSSVQLSRDRSNLVALNFGDLGDASKLDLLARLLERYPGVSITLLPTLYNLQTVLAADSLGWQRWLDAGHEIAFAAGMGEISAEYLQWQTLLGKANQAHFATDLRNLPSKALAVHSARHGMLVAAWQAARQLPSVTQIIEQKSVLISAETTDLTTLDQRLAQLSENSQQMVTLTDLMRNNRNLIEKLEVDSGGYQSGYDWLYR